jgi:hypothetical protein
MYPGKIIPDVTDRELNALFTLTRQKKGPNILFIADCCYAASVSRSGRVASILKDRTVPALGWDEALDSLSRTQRNIDRVSIFPVVCYG